MKAPPLRQARIVFCVTSMLTLPVEAQTFFTRVPDEALGTRLFPSRSTAFGDHDSDGWPDLFLAASQFGVRTRLALLRNKEGTGFEGRSAAIEEVAPRRVRGGGAIFGDYDRDGDLDLFVSCGGGLRRQGTSCFATIGGPLSVWPRRPLHWGIAAAGE